MTILGQNVELHCTCVVEIFVIQPQMIHLCLSLFPHIVLIKQLYKDKRITAEEASQLTSTKLFTVPPPTNATTILTIDGTDSSTTSCNVRSSYVCNTSIVDTNNTSSVATNQHVNALTSELAVETSDALAHATRTTNTHINNTSSIANSVFTSAVLDQHGQLECMSIGASVQPAIVEAHDLSNMTAVQSTDTNNVHHTVQSLQSISATEMTENLVNNIATDETVEDTSQIVYAVSDNEHGSMPETPLLAHSQQGNTRKGKNVQEYHAGEYGYCMHAWIFLRVLYIYYFVESNPGRISLCSYFLWSIQVVYINYVLLS